nr:hypothetical protein 1573p1_00007 [Serratia marcescens]
MPTWGERLVSEKPASTIISRGKPIWVLPTANTRSGCSASLVTLYMRFLRVCSASGHILMRLLVVPREGKCAVFTSCYLTVTSSVPSYKRPSASWYRKKYLYLKISSPPGKKAANLNPSPHPDELAIIVCTAQ